MSTPEVIHQHYESSDIAQEFWDSAKEYEAFIHNLSLAISHYGTKKAIWQRWLEICEEPGTMSRFKQATAQALTKSKIQKIEVYKERKPREGNRFIMLRRKYKGFNVEEYCMSFGSAEEAKNMTRIQRELFPDQEINCYELVALD